MSPHPRSQADAKPRLRQLSLEITGRCQFECDFCYAESSPRGTDGSMATSDWIRTIDEAAAIGCGLVQFIGGEPTLHPEFDRLVEWTLDREFEVEVYTNLFHVPNRRWELFRRPRMRLATSYHSDDAAEHDGIVHRTRAHARTEANIAKARELGIPLRAGVIRTTYAQRVAEAEERLKQLGVTSVGHDDLRGVGRGTTGAPNVDALCGRCADESLVILPNGNAHPCVFSRWPEMLGGNVQAQRLAEILGGAKLAGVRRALREHFDVRAADTVTPTAVCEPYCAPNCAPVIGCVPDLPCGPGNGDRCDPTYCTPYCNPSNCPPAGKG